MDLASVKAWAGSRNGKIALGGGSVGGVVLLGLHARSKGSSDGSGAVAPFSQAPEPDGTAQSILDSFDQAGIDVGSFAELVGELGEIADRLDTTTGTSSPAHHQKGAAPGGAKPAGPSPDTVEAFVRRIVKANPALKGRTTIPGGMEIRIPLAGGKVAKHRIGQVGHTYSIRTQATRFAEMYSGK